MSKIFEDFQEFRKILCVCPCCGDLVRVSDLKLRIKAPYKKTWLDEYEYKLNLINKKIERFEEKKENLRNLAREKGRKAAKIIVNSLIDPSLRKLDFDPYDLKPLLYPIDFIVFSGMTEESFISKIVFLSKSVNDKQTNQYRSQIKNVILSKDYEWELIRINEIGHIRFE
ncbi:MAG: Holliday junction resolvase-like protein [Candidatus Micrarchaeia archaeon]